MKRKTKNKRLKKKPSKAQLLATVVILTACFSALIYGNADQTNRSNQTAPSEYSANSTDVVDLSPQTSAPGSPAVNPQVPAGTNVGTGSPSGAMPDNNLTPYDAPPYCKPGLDQKVLCYKFPQ